MTIRAIYENGVLRPIVPLQLPDKTAVTLDLRVPSSANGTASDPDSMDEIYAILGERYNSGHTDSAERHNEHQP